MSSKYPAELDALSTGSENATKSENTHPALHNDANDAINKIEAELGVNPSGTSSTVAARLEVLALPIYNIKDAAYGATTGAADNATAINAAITAANEAGGGRVIVPIGEFLHGGITKKSNVYLEGVHPEMSVLKLKNGANTDCVTTANYGAGGQDFFGIFNLKIDGNKANNASGGMGLKLDGRRLRVAGVRVKNCKSDGINHKQTASDLSAAEGGSDSLFSDFVVWNNDGNGIVHQAHDAQWQEGFCIGNAKANVLHPSSTGPMVCYGIHVWGASEYGWKLEDETLCTGCEAEGASKSQVYVGNATVTWDGLVFVAGTPENVPGIELASAGSVVRTSPTTIISGTGTAGGVKFAAEGSSASRFLHHFYDPGVAQPAFTKAEGVTPSRGITIDISLGGSSVIGEGFINGRRPKHMSINPLRTKDPSRPEGTKAENYPRLWANFQNSSVLTSGTLYLVYGLILPADEAISAIHFYSATTAAVTPENQWACLLDSSRKVLAVSKDKTTEAWGANAKKTLELESAYTPPWGEDKPVYVGLLVKAATVPTLQAIESTNTFPHNQAPILAGNSNTGLTVPGGLAVGATSTAITATAKRPYCTVN